MKSEIIEDKYLVCGNCQHWSRVKHPGGSSDYSRCSILLSKTTRTHSCDNHELKPLMIEYCPTCDAETPSVDWFCSVCWSDRIDSELFENE